MNKNDFKFSSLTSLNTSLSPNLNVTKHKFNAGILITPLQFKHLKQLEKIEKLCFSTPWSYDSLAQQLDNPVAVFYVVENTETNSCVGYIGMHHILDEGFITNIAIDPSCRRQGIASKLIKKIIDYACKNKIARISLEVRKSNDFAINLYKKHGFINEGVRKDYYHSPKEDAFIYSLYF